MPPHEPTRCGYKIYTIVLLPRRRAVHSRHRTKVNPHPTNQQGLGRRKGKPKGTPTIGRFFAVGKKWWCGRLPENSKHARREHLQRQDESRQAWGGPNLAQPHADKTRGENGKHRTGTKHSRRRTERTGRQAPLPTDRIGAGRRTPNRGERESNAHTRTAKARRQALLPTAEVESKNYNNY